MIAVAQEKQKLGHLVPEASRRFLKESAARGRQGIESCMSANLTEAFFDRYGREPLRRRQALAFGYALENEPVRLFPRERLVGQVYHFVKGAGCPGLYDCGDERWREFNALRHSNRRQREEIPQIESILYKPSKGQPERPWL